MAFIYLITNDINNKVYVGKTEADIFIRFKEHCRDALRDRNKNRPLYSAMRKYGAEHFSIRVLEETNDPEEREKFWIAYFNSYHIGYNATSGGDGKCLFDYDKILGELIFDNDYNNVAAKIGCCVDTVRMVARAHGLGIGESVSVNLRGMSELQQKSVVGYNKDFLVSFSSLRDAAEWLYEIGFTKSKGKSVRSHISECAKGLKKSAYKMKWSFLDGC